VLPDVADVARGSSGVPARRSGTGNADPDSLLIPSTPWHGRRVDLRTPNVARVYDYYLGGGSNFGVDRDFAWRAMSIMPDLPRIAANNRRFIHRAVRHGVSQGIRQFLDIGCGIPGVGMVHEIAQRAAPDCRVVYVDIEPIAVAAGRERVAGDPHTVMLSADARQPEAIFAHPDAQALLDVDEPICVIVTLLWHFFPDEVDPRGILRRYRRHLAPGSQLVFSHNTAEGREGDMRQFQALYEESSDPLVLRSRAELAELLADFTVLEPGIVYPSLWRPEQHDDDVEDPTLSGILAAVATV
jgi:SAM-dependent methyltransferase